MSTGEGPIGCTSRHEVPGENFSTSGCTLALACMYLGSGSGSGAGAGSGSGSG